MEAEQKQKTNITQFTCDEKASPQASWLSLDPKLKRIIISGIAAIVVLILLVIFLSATILSSMLEVRSLSAPARRLSGATRPVCIISETIPESDLPSVAYMQPNATGMAKLSGYIHYYNVGFQALDIKYMSYDNDTKRITLGDDCVSLSISRFSHTDGTEYLAKLIWYLTEYNEQLEDKFDNCDTTPSFAHAFPSRDRYSCTRERESHQCKKIGTDKKYHAIAELFIESFELELDGKPEIIEQGKFSKPPFPASCRE